MKRLFIYLGVMLVTWCQAEVPKLLTERTFTSATLAEAVNHYIAIGEPAAFKELEAFIAHETAQTNWMLNRGYSVDERIAWIFRVLYEPKPGIAMMVPKTGKLIPGNIFELRAPDFGTLDIPEASMPAENWPLYPLAQSGSTFIVLKERYTPAGPIETISHYMEYCKDNGVFRTTPIPVPTRQQAMKAAEELRQSAPWQAIKWVRNGGTSFPLGEQWTYGFILSQVRNIPEANIAKKSSKNTHLTALSTP